MAGHISTSIATTVYLSINSQTACFPVASHAPVSGTYNNQYMVVDLNKIRLEESIEDNALRIAEQIPGYNLGPIHTEHVT